MEKILLYNLCGQSNHVLHGGDGKWSDYAMKNIFGVRIMGEEPSEHKPIPWQNPLLMNQ